MFNPGDVAMEDIQAVSGNIAVTVEQ